VNKEELETALASEKSEHADTKSQLEQEKTEHATTKAELKKEKDDHQKTIEESTNVVNELKAKVDEKSKAIAAAGKVTISHKGKKYLVKIPSFNLDGKIFKTEDLKSN